MNVCPFLPVAAFLVVNAANSEVPNAGVEPLALEPCVNGAVSPSGIFPAGAMVDHGQHRSPVACQGRRLRVQAQSSP